MKKYSICFLFALAVAGIHSCKSNKMPCPTYQYANSLPEKKKKTKPGAQKPEMPKYTKPKSDVMPRKK
jgi:hypothetical protein